MDEHPPARPRTHAPGELPLGMRILFVAIFLLIAYQAFFGTSQSPPKPGMPAPALSLTRVAHQKTWQPSFHKGVTILQFWATWCGVCKRTLRHSSALAARLQREGVQHLLINTDARLPAAELQAFLRAQQVPRSLWGVHHQDTSARGATRYRIRSLPTFVLIDAKGKIARTFVGYVGAAPLRRAVQALQRSVPNKR